MFYKLPLRTRIGILAILCWIGILAGIVQYYKTGNDLLFKMFNRVGIFLLFLWMAWPELERLPRWVYFVMPIMIIVAVWRPQMLIIVVPLALLYWYIRPKPESSQNSKK